MATDIVGGLFGVTPESYQREQRMLAEREAMGFGFWNLARRRKCVPSVYQGRDMESLCRYACACTDPRTSPTAESAASSITSALGANPRPSSDTETF